MNALGLLDTLFEGFKGTVDLGSGADLSDINMGFEVEFVLLAPAYKKRTEASTRSWQKQALAVTFTHLNRVVAERCQLLRDYTHNKRAKNVWYVEPDSSVGSFGQGDMSAGVEISSPVFPSVDRGMYEMKRAFSVIKLLRQDGHRAFTNGTCGLHVSLGFSKEPKINLLKLFLLFGEKYVGRLFGRENSSFAMSALQGFQERMTAWDSSNYGGTRYPRPRNVTELEEAFKRFSSTVGHSHSINLEHFLGGKKYFEFRLAGGENYELDTDKIDSTVTRYATALKAACDPGTLRQEYLKKAGQLIGSTADAPKLNAFQQGTKAANDQGLDFSEMTPQELKKFAARKLSGLQGAIAAVKKGEPIAPNERYPGTWGEITRRLAKFPTTMVALRREFSLRKLDPAPVAKISQRWQYVQTQQAKDAAKAAKRVASDEKARNAYWKKEMRIRKLRALIDQEAAKQNPNVEWIKQKAQLLVKLGYTIPENERRYWDLGADFGAETGWEVPDDYVVHTPEEYQRAKTRATALAANRPGPFSNEGQQLARLQSAMADWEHMMQPPSPDIARADSPLF